MTAQNGSVRQRSTAARSDAPSSSALTLRDASNLQLARAIEAGEQRMRGVLATQMTLTASAVCVAGAAHGLLGSPWVAIAMAFGASAAMFGAASPGTKIAARTVVESLAAVAIYSAARAIGEEQRARDERDAQLDETRRYHARFFQASAANAEVPARSTPIPPAVTDDLSDRALTPEHEEAIEQCERGAGGPTIARRTARRLIAQIERDAQRIETSVAERDEVALVNEMRAALDEARAHLRRARLIDEVTEIRAWNYASLAARRHAAQRMATSKSYRAWDEDAALLAQGEALVRGAENSIDGERSR